jgi:hypothetical protein
MLGCDSSCVRLLVILTSWAFNGCHQIEQTGCILCCSGEVQGGTTWLLDLGKNLEIPSVISGTVQAGNQLACVGGSTVLLQVT